MTSYRTFRLLPVLLFVVALAIRLVGLSWGLPTSERFYSYHPDERQMLGAVATVVGGDLNPHFFNYPSLFIYFSAVAHFVALGFSSPSGNSLWAISHDILLHARLVSAFLGALTVPVVFLLGREIGGAKIGVLAALILCFAPAHVQHSHFATVDVAATFWIALSLLFATRALHFSAEKVSVSNVAAKDKSAPNSSDASELAANANRKTVKTLMLSALFAGVAAATKYNAIFVLIAPIVACFLIEYSMAKTRRVLLALGVICVGVLGFLIGCPFSVLSFGEFWGDGKNMGVAYELLVHPKQGSGDIFTNTGNGWIYHATFNLPFAMTLPVAIATLLGLLLVVEGLIKSRKSHSDYRVLVPTLGFALFYFFALGFSQVRFLRYTLPLLPALAVFAALFIRALVSALRTKNSSLKFAIATSFLFVPIVGTFNVLWPLTQTDARDAAKHWLDSQPEKLPISVGLADAQNPLWFYTPPFWPQDVPPGASISWKDATRNPRYELVPIGLNAQFLGEKRPRYFVWSAFQWRESERLNDVKVAQLRQKLRIEYSMTSFEAKPPLQLPGRAFVPHDFLYTTPRVEVWTRK